VQTGYISKTRSLGKKQSDYTPNSNKANAPKAKYELREMQQKE